MIAALTNGVVLQALKENQRPLGLGKIELGLGTIWARMDGATMPNAQPMASLKRTASSIGEPNHNPDLKKGRLEVMHDALIFPSFSLAVVAEQHRHSRGFENPRTVHDLCFSTREETRHRFLKRNKNLC